MDGLTSMQKLNAKIAAGQTYDMIEVMVCPGGCINGGGLSFSSTKEIIRNRARTIWQAEESEAVSVASKSPALLSFYEDTSKGEDEPNERKSFFTRYSRRDVLL